MTMVPVPHHRNPPLVSELTLSQLVSLQHNSHGHIDSHPAMTPDS